jgi:hypothetical protein
MAMNSVGWNGRAVALSIALAACSAACGDDDEPSKDAGGDAAMQNPNDGSAPAMDAGPDDGGTPTAPDATLEAGPGDASQPADAGDGGSSGDGGMDELSAALQIQGTRADARRAELVLTEYCKNFVLCEGPDAGVSQQDCFADVGEGYMDEVQAGAPLACLDALLDVGSCLATIACEREPDCDALDEIADQLCPVDDGGL